MRNDNDVSEMSREALDFSIFCIENLALRLHADPAKVYRALAVDSDILDTCVIPCWDVLHTQSKEYILDDIERLMAKKGVHL